MADLTTCPYFLQSRIFDLSSHCFLQTKIFLSYYFLKLLLHHFLKIKSHKEVTKQRESRFCICIFT
jgi:hypothetical protein